MAKNIRSFTSGRMNKMLDEKLVPNGEYIHAMNVRLNSSEAGEVGVIENSKGNELLAEVRDINGVALSANALTIGSFADSARETIYWAVHDPTHKPDPNDPATIKLDLLLSYNTRTNVLRTHIHSVSVMNFDPQYPITGWSMVDDLLFFTDGLNNPRYININRDYVADSNLTSDWVGLDEATRVIRRPPLGSPNIRPVRIGGQNNYIEDRFLSFAYRYRYADNMYSATSQWSEVAFIPTVFSVDYNGFINGGMRNAANAVFVTYNTGNEFVLEIELLYKDARSNVIKVLEKINKDQSALGNLQDVDYLFSLQKIFTVLPQSELLRLYDNVPKWAVGQTIMGNRLVYGNYLEGYNIDTILNYQASLLSEDFENNDIPTLLGDNVYNISGILVGVNNCEVILDLDGVDLRAGSAINISISFEHDKFSGATPPTTTQEESIDFTFVLPRDYGSAFELATSAEFQNSIIRTQPNSTSCDGVSFTDAMNCVIPNALGTFTRTGSGVDSPSGGIEIFASTSSSLIGLQILATEYDDTGVKAYEYYKITRHSASIQSSQSPKSLHSNRSYEVGLIYMDEYARSTNALTVQNNAVYVPCEASVFQNKIKVDIFNLAPSWARYYKFAIKTDKEDYETVYSYLFFQDPESNATYFLLEGENMRKVEAGDRLYVKKDTSGALANCVSAVVLEKEAKEENFISIQNVRVPSGVYIKMNATSFSTEFNDLDTYDTGERYIEETISGTAPKMNLRIFTGDLPTYDTIDIPAGTRITLDFEFLRVGNNNNCTRRSYTLNLSLVARADYADFKQWWDSENLAELIKTGSAFVGSGGDIFNVYIPTMASSLTDIPTDVATNYWRFYEDVSNNRLFLLVTGTKACSNLVRVSRRKSTIKGRITIIKSENTIVWETEPSESQPNVFYEGDQVFEIDPITRLHSGNIQNQTSSQPAEVETSFFNCFTFGNGVESYKIRDSIVGRSFLLGNRFYSTTVQEYKEAHRFADLTYSGVYNNETNVNRLNEFNLGQLNFKELERIYGSVQILDGRETDVLVLQEDKISTVLAGKNLLSDAEAGGTIVSIPEVLGTQVARTENYGISKNRESYAVWGVDRFFTDIKRNAVLNLKGNGTANDQLIVISEMGMRNWFRDEFIARFNTRKLGGFDPYTNEYVLTSTDRELPSAAGCLACGTVQTFELENDAEISFCVNFRNLVGDIDVNYAISNLTGTDASIEVEVDYNGDTFTSGEVDESGDFTFEKGEVNVTSGDVRLKLNGTKATVQLSIGCPQAVSQCIVEVVVGGGDLAGETTHIQYNYQSGTFTSPRVTNQIQFASGSDNPLVSRFNKFSGLRGSSGIPTLGSTVTLYNNRIGTDSFSFDPAMHKFRYLVSGTDYQNTPADIAALLAASNVVTPITGSDPEFSADFLFDEGEGCLYLIWDMRTIEEVELDYEESDLEKLCCNICLPEEED